MGVGGGWQTDRYILVKHKEKNTTPPLLSTFLGSDDRTNKGKHHEILI